MNSIQTQSRKIRHGYWDFGESHEPLIHRIHAYPAKFPSFITVKAVSRARKEGVDVKTVADIFCGCGTTAFESRRLGLDFWGCDINPVAVLIAKVKSNTYGIGELKRLHSRIKRRFRKGDASDVSIDDLPPRLHYWYHDDDAKELKLLLRIIESETRKGKYRDFFLCAFSNILKGVSRWLTKSIKPQIDPAKKRIPVLDTFNQQVATMVKAVQESALDEGTNRSIERLDALTDAIPEAMADVVVTSPPYVTSYEYADLHQLSTLWLGYAKDYRDLRKGTIGSVHQTETTNRKDELNAVGQRIVTSLEKVGSSKAKASARYFSDMNRIVTRCGSLLRPGGMVFFVIGDTEYKGVKVSNSTYLRTCLRDAGFQSIRMEKRKITGKNLSPYRTDKGKFSSNPDDRKVYAEEFVLSGRKEA